MAASSVLRLLSADIRTAKAPQSALVATIFGQSARGAAGHHVRFRYGKDME